MSKSLRVERIREFRNRSEPEGLCSVTSAESETIMEILALALSLHEITNVKYRTTRTTDAQCTELLKRLGYKVRYLAVRLATTPSTPWARATTMMSSASPGGEIP